MIAKDLDAHACEIFAAAITGAAPAQLLGKYQLAHHIERPADKYAKIILLGAGKASLPFAAAVAKQLPLTTGCITIPAGYLAHSPPTITVPPGITVFEASHPIPDKAGLNAAASALASAKEAGADDLVITLISGGGSALWPAFAPGIDLAAARSCFAQLLASGATIREFNTLRKQISLIGGGRLSAAAAPAEMLALVISDVPGDDLSVIASGPTIPDKTTRDEAIGILHNYFLWDTIAAPIRKHLTTGDQGPTPANPRSRTLLVGTNGDALNAAAIKARELGYETKITPEPITGEASHVGRDLARQLLAGTPPKATCSLWGGETTVTVKGNGKGGRNQEVALGAACELAGHPRPIVLLSGGTDGVDGPTDAAGATASPETMAAGQSLGLDPVATLDNNDAYTFFDQIGGLIKTGPTHTNVMDIQIGLQDRATP